MSNVAGCYLNVDNVLILCYTSGIMANQTVFMWLPADLLKRLEKAMPALRGNRKHKIRVEVALHQWLDQHQQTSTRSRKAS